MNRYTPERLVSVSRYQNYFPTLERDVQAEVLTRMADLHGEERAFCDKGNEKHMAQILFVRQQTKRWFSSVQLPEPFLRSGFRHRIPIPASFCLLVEQ